MNQECINSAADTAGSIATIEPTTLYVSRVGGGSVAVERFDDRKRVAAGVGRVSDFNHPRTLVVHLSDVVPGDRLDVVYLDADQTDEVETLDRAIEALQIAREAFSRTKVTA